MYITYLILSVTYIAQQKYRKKEEKNIIILLVDIESSQCIPMNMDCQLWWFSMVFSLYLFNLKETI